MLGELSMINKYDESSIQVLEGLKGVRKRPAMYIGSTDSIGLHHLVWEILDNSIDEVIAGYCDEIKIKLNLDGSITISDNGRGIPIGLHKTGMSTPRVIFSKLHSGGKFGGSGYKTSGGLHGVGSSVVNALSSKFESQIHRDGGIYEIKFANGGKLIQKLTKIKNSKLTGTSVTFLPDNKIFSSIKFSKTTIIERIKESAYLNPTLKITFFDLDKNITVFHYPAGLESFIENLNQNKTTKNKPLYYAAELDEIKLFLALQYTDDYSETIISFANNIKTIDGGTHVSGFKVALTRAINDYARQEKLIKSDTKIDALDIREGLSVVISVLIPEKIIQYEGQTKAKLSSIKVKKVVENLSYEKLFFWLQANKNSTKNIINKIFISQKARMAAKKAKAIVRLGKNSKNERIKLLSGKLTPAYSTKKIEKELFIVEGDSAGGSAKLGRDKMFQAILPLRGKIINAIKSTESDLLSNLEIKTIINAIGGGIGNTFNVENINYGKIVIMTDADTDGAHIQTLLLAFFYKYMKDLFNNKNLYIALSPLYKLNYQDKHKYYWDEFSLKQKINKLNNVKYRIQRYKGLGEMNADQLWDTTMNPENRLLIQITIDDAYIANEKMNTLMGTESEKRKQWIDENVNFTSEEQINFEK